MTRQNKLELEKPSWFDLNKYRHSAKADLQQWIMNLESRVMALHLLTNGDELAGYYLGDVLKFREQGFIIFDDTNPVHHHDYNKSYANTMDVADVGMLYDLIPEDTKKDIKEYVNNDGEFTEKMEQEITELTWLEGDENIYAQIAINAPIEIIKKDFEKWLVKKKEEFNKKIGFNKRTHINNKKKFDWFNSRVIPYMDLLICIKQNGRDEHEKGIPTTIGQWLYPELDKASAESRLRRTAVKHVEDIKKYEFLEYNQRQLSLELRKQYQQNAKPTK